MRLFLVASLAVVLIFSGCISNSPSPAKTMLENSPSADAMMDKAKQMDGGLDEQAASETGMMEKKETVSTDAGTMMESGVKYDSFTQAAYDKAKADGKIIFLEFYANWCPICQAQAPALESGLSQIHDDSLVAFRVNYKDDETDAEETALAKKFNITYQHTHILIDASEQVLLRSQEMWNKEDVVQKLATATYN